MYVKYDRLDPNDKDLIGWNSLVENARNMNIKFDFALLFTGYVGYHCLNMCCKRPDGKYYTPLNAFKRYCGPYVHLVNSLNIPLYTIAEDPRYITINTEELFVRERLILTQMVDCTVPVAQKYITSYEDHTHIEKTPIPCTYAGVEKIFLMGIDKNWRDKIDIERKINNTKNPKCIVISNGHGTSGLNSGAVQKDGRLPGYLEYHELEFNLVEISPEMSDEELNPVFQFIEDHPNPQEFLTEGQTETEPLAPSFYFIVDGEVEEIFIGPDMDEKKLDEFVQKYQLVK
jgi:hypothetical protein